MSLPLLIQRCFLPAFFVLLLPHLAFAQADAGDNQLVCGQSANLTGSVAQDTSVKWTVLFGDGVLENPVDPQSVINNLSFGKNVLLYEYIFDEISYSTDTLIIYRYNVIDNQTINYFVCGDNLPEASNGGPFDSLAIWMYPPGIQPVTDSTFSASSLNPGLNIFNIKILYPDCDSSIITIHINSDTILTAQAGDDQTICDDSTQLAATPAAGGIWTVISGAGTFEDASLANSAVTAMAAGENVFRWTVPGGACDSVFDELSVFVEQPPQPAQAGDDQTICDDSTQLAATPAAGGIWTVISGAGTFEDASLANSAVTAMAAGENVFRWTVPGGACDSVFDELSVFVEQPPQPAQAGDDQTICDDSTQLAATPAAGGIWTVISGAGTFEDASLANSSVTAMAAGENVFRWTIPGGACDSVFDELSVFVEQPPQPAQAGDDQTICDDSTQLAATPAAGGIWTVISGAGTFEDASLANSSVTAMAAGENVFRWTVPGGACDSVFDELSVFVEQPPQPAQAGDDQTICDDSTQLAATPAAGGIWTVISGAGTFEDASLANSSVTAMAAGENVFRWTIPGGACDSVFDELSVFVEQPPQPAQAGDDQTICDDSTQLAATPAAGGIWTVISGAGTFEDASLANSSVTAMAAGENVFRWTIPGGACDSVFDELSVFVEQPPQPAQAGDDQTICDDSTQLAATPAAGGIWTVISGAGIFEDASLANSSVTAMAAGENVFRWTIPGGACDSVFDELSVFVEQPPQPAQAGDDQTICDDSTQLAATPAAGGIWTVISGAGIFEDASLANSSVTAMAAGENVFRWTVPGGACDSVFDELSVFVEQPPQPAHAGDDQTICDDSTQLAATPAAGGIWTVISGAGTFEDASLANSSVTAMAAGENVFRWTVPGGACDSVFDELSVFVEQPPQPAQAGDDQTICDDSTQLAATPAAGGIWTVISGAGTFEDASLANSSVTAMAAGENVFRWTIPGGACASAFDEVSINVDAAPSAAIAGADQTVCATTATLAANTPGTGTGAWSVVSGTAVFSNASQPNSGVSGLAVGANVLRWTISNGTCAPSTDELTITVQENPVNPYAGPDQTICATSTTLAATPAAGGLWSVISGTGTLANASLANSAVTGLSVGTNVFRWTIPGGACASAFDEVSINVDAAPSAAIAGADQTVCATTATLAANTPGTGTGVWSVVSGTAVFSNASQPNSGVSGLAVGANVLRWTISNGTCAPSTDELTITVQENPVNPYAGPDQTICATSSTLAATPAAGGLWSVITGTGTLANASLANSAVTGLSVGTNVFRWTIPGGACASAFDEVSINVDAAPSAAIAGADQTVCATTATLAANTPGTGTGAWSVVSGTAVFSNASQPNSGVSGLAVGANVLRWTISNGTCAPSTDELTITVQENPVNPYAGPDQTICATSTTLAATPAAGGLWSVISGTGTLANASLANSAVTGLSVGTNVFRWTIPGGACASAFDEVSINVDAAPSAAIAGADQTVCATTATLAANTPGTGTGVWSVVSGTAVFSNASQPNSGVSGLAVGANVLRWTISNGTCAPSTDELTITVQENPVNPYAGPDQTICATSTTLAATPAAGGLWSVISGTGTLANASLANSAVTGLSVGTNVFRWTIPGGACASAFDEVSINVDAAPSAAIAGADQTVCATTATLAANTPGTGTGVWSVVSGTAVFSNASQPNSGVSGLAVGANVLRWTISNGTCAPSTDELTITVQENPVNPYAGPDQTICATSTTLAATPAAGGLWSVISGTGTLANASLANSAVTGLSVGTNVFRWTIPGGACASAFDEVSINVDAAPSAAIAGADQTVCATTATLAANTPGTGTGVWSVVSGTAVFSNASQPNSGVSGLAVGANVLRWTISNGTCAPSTDELTITVQENPVNPYAGPDQTICATSTTLAATPAAGGLWSVISGTGTLANASLANSAVTGLSVGTNVFRWTIPGGACASAFDEVSINVDAAPSAAIAGADQTVCATTATLAANTPGTGTGVWSVVSGTAVFSNASQPNSGVSGLAVGANVLRWTISNGTCAPSTDELTITVQENPVNPYAGPDQTICATSTTLAATPAAGGLWSVISGTGTLANASLANSAVTGLSVGTNVFRWTIPGGACASAFDEVSINVDAAPSAAIAGADQTVCATTATLAANTPGTGTGAWSVVSGTAVFSNASQPNSGVSGLAVGANVLRWTISNGVCVSSFDDIIITREQSPVADAGIDQRVCIGTNIVLQANSANGGVWTLVSGSGVIQTPGQANSSVQGLSAGVSVFKWTVPGNTCPASSDQVNITVDALPSLANAGPDQNICNTGSTVSGNTPVSGNGTWSIISGNGLVSSPNSPVTGVNSLSPGQNILQWSIVNGVCPASTDQVNIQVLQAPSGANAGTDQEVCGNTAQLDAAQPDAGTGTWSLISGGGTFANPAQRNTQVSGLSNGLNIFRWTVTNGNCPVRADEVQIHSYTAPTPASAGADASICNLPLVLQGNTPISGSGLWTIVSGGGSLSNPGQPNAGVSNMSAGQLVLRWTISNGACPPSFDEVVYSVYNQPFASAGQNTLICSSTINMSGNAVAGANGNWSFVSGSGNIQSPGNPQTFVSNLAQGANTLVWTLNNSVCPVSRDTVVITRYLEPDNPIAGADIHTCASNAQLNANTPVSGTGFWVVLQGGGIIDAPSSASTMVTNLSSGKNVLIWTISNGTCNPRSDTLEIKVDTNPTSANAGTDQDICGNSTALSAVNPLVGNGTWVLVSGTGNIQLPDQAVTALTNLGVGKNTFRWTVVNGSCVTSDEVQITRYLPPSPADAGPDQSICSSTSQLNAAAINVGNGNWSLISGGGTLTNAGSRTSAVTGLAYGANVFRWTVSSGACPANNDEVTIFRQTEPGPALVAADTAICAATIQISASTPQAGTGIWSLVSGSGEINNPLLVNISLSALAAGENVFRWTVVNGDCPAVSDEITILRHLPPSTANAGADFSSCLTDITLNAVIPATGTGTWSRLSGLGNILQATNAKSAVNNLIPGISVFEWTVSNGTCPVSRDQVQVEVFPGPGQPDAGLDVTICGDSTIVSGNFPDNASSLWSVLSGSGIIQHPAVAQTSVKQLTGGENVLVYTFSNGPCQANDTLKIYAFMPPGLAFAGNDTSICADEFIALAEAPQAGSGQWSVLEGNALLAADSLASTLIQLPEEGEYVFYWEITNGVCPANGDTLVIIRDIQPDTAEIVSNSAIICTDSLWLQAKDYTLSQGSWSILSGDGIFSSTDSAHTALTGIGEGLNQIEWVLTKGACRSADTIEIERFLNPAPLSLGGDLKICGLNASLDAEVPDFGQGQWIYDETRSGLDDPSSAFTTIEAYQEGVLRYIWEHSNGPCIARDSVEITFYIQPDAHAGDDITICSGDTAYLQGNIPDAGVSTWSLITGEGLILQPYFQNSEFIPKEEGNYYLRWTVVNEMCRDSDLVVVSVRSPNDPFCMNKAGKLFVPDGFSPNADGVFDYLVIQKPFGSRVSLQVFDRLGNMVYESRDYQNDWDGRPRKGLVLYGDQLPESTYFYILRIDDKDEEYKGYFTLWR